MYQYAALIFLTHLTLLRESGTNLVITIKLERNTDEESLFPATYVRATLHSDAFRDTPKHL